MFIILAISISIASLISIVKCQTIEYPTVNCQTISGSNSGYLDDDESRVNCNTLGSTYRMTSCGLWSAWSNIDGSFIDSSNGDCVARMGSGGLSGQYVSAVAHCCQFDITATCIVRTGTKSGTNDDAESVVYCQSNEQLTGCTVLTEQKNIDGAKPVLSQNKCTAFNGAGGNGVWAYAQCCSYTTPTNPRYTMQLDCYHSQSGLSGTGDGNNAQIGCNNGYFISGCSGWNSSPSLKSWRIENNQCVATNSAVGNGVYAYVICCREIKTYIPTKHPTSDPTYNPTFIPTLTLNPTKIPTVSPTTVSKQPTSIPTSTPTTSNPTPTPIEIVVNNPTAAPEPSNIPTSFQFNTSIYEITVEFYANPDEDLVLIAVATTYPESQVMSVEMDDVSVIIMLSITSNTKLSSNEIQQTLLDELEDEQDIKNIDVVQVKDDNGKQKETQSFLWIILIIIGIIVVLVVSFIIYFVCYRRKRKINHETTAENVEMKISDPGDHETTQGEDDVIEAISSAVKNVEGQTSGRWYSPEIINKKQEDDDIYSDEINGVEPIIKKEDKWKYAYVLDKTPQHKQSTQNGNNNQQSVTIENDLSKGDSENNKNTHNST